MNKILRILLLLTGSLCMVLGFIGLLLPIMPTTPFLLIAAACYVRSSDRLYNLLVGNRFFGKYLKNYREGKGVPKRAKIAAICSLWLTIGCSVLFFIPLVYIKALMLIIASGVTWYIISLKTAEE